MPGLLHDWRDIHPPSCGLVGSNAWRYINMTDNREKIREEMREFSEQVQRDYIELIRLFPENRGKEQEIVQNHLSSEAID